MEPTPLEVFGLRVRSYREKLGISQEDLAYRSSITRNHVHEVEHGRKNVSFDTIHRLATGLNVRMAQLMPDWRRKK